MTTTINFTDLDVDVKVGHFILTVIAVARSSIPKSAPLTCSLVNRTYVSLMNTLTKVHDPTTAPITRGAVVARASRVVRKVNFPQEEHLYHDLVSLSINDNSLFSSNEDKHHRREVSFTNKDLEPQLSDFFTPSFGEERHLLDRPSFKGVEANRRFNGFILYKRQQAWSLVD
uniref:Protein phosphatase 1 regulatory subunit 35 C-terminal domain-containing protein n=1 Tax=Timema monikensis TaxID=170555 RepID=A0A7R9EGC4_9NEOP|nr:unnamed protein product [Timema monikensis]